MVYVEDDKVLYVGDAIYAKYLPTLKFGNIELWKKWLNTLKSIEDLNAGNVVPGHGRVLRKSEIILEIRRHEMIVRNKLS